MKRGNLDTFKTIVNITAKIVGIILSLIVLPTTLPANWSALTARFPGLLTVPWSRVGLIVLFSLLLVVCVWSVVRTISLVRRRPRIAVTVKDIWLGFRPVKDRQPERKIMFFWTPSLVLELRNRGLTKVTVREARACMSVRGKTVAAFDDRNGTHTLERKASEYLFLSSDELSADSHAASLYPSGQYQLKYVYKATTYTSGHAWVFDSREAVAASETTKADWMETGCRELDERIHDLCMSRFGL